MQHVDFGGKVDIQALFERLIKRVPRICATDAKQLLLHHYETSYGIYDHEHNQDKDNPLALVLMHPAEHVHGALFERIDEFEERQVLQRFGCSLQEFLEFPREVCEYLLRRAVKLQKDANSLQEEQLRKLDDIRRG